MSLKYNDTSHRYWIDGKPVRGVTGLIGGGLPKPALIKWGPRVVADYVVDRIDEVIEDHQANPEALRFRLAKLPEEHRDTAAVRGTEVHEIAEKIIHGQSVDVPDRLLPYVKGYVEWLDSRGVEPIITEQSLGNRTHQYAGRVDCIGKVAALDGRTLLVDWKTSRSVYSSTALQVAAYARAEFTVSDDDPDTEIPVPEVDGCIVVHITPDGTKAHWLCRTPEEINEAFGDFLTVAAVSRRIDRIDGKWNAKARKAFGGYLDLDDVIGVAS